jgi:hypothetical protein
MSRDSFLLHLRFTNNNMREKFVLNGDGIVWVRFVDSEEEGEKKAGGVKALNALRKRAKKSSASPPVVS